MKTFRVLAKGLSTIGPSHARAHKVIAGLEIAGVRDLRIGPRDDPRRKVQYSAATSASRW